MARLQHHATLAIAADGFLVSEREPTPLKRSGSQLFPQFAYVQATSREDPPLRPERHVPNSIATMRRKLMVALAATLSRCPCCTVPNEHRNL